MLGRRDSAARHGHGERRTPMYLRSWAKLVAWAAGEKARDGLEKRIAGKHRAEACPSAFHCHLSALP